LRERTVARTGPLTPAQRRLWFLEQLDPGQPTYHVPTIVRLAGRLDEAALRQAVDELVRRHEALRTVIDVRGGEAQQRVIPKLEIPVSSIVLAPGPAAETDADRNARIERSVHDEVRRGFDLLRGPLIRAAILHVASDLAFLVLTVHHFVADGWSLALMLRELDALYQAFARRERPVLAEPRLQYLDYARWLELQLSGERLPRLLGFWQNALDGAPAHINLPTDRPRPAVSSLRGALRPFELGPTEVDRLRALVRESDATLFMGLLAALAVLLHRRSREVDIVIGSPVANRGHVEMEGLVGLCANVLPLRIDLRGDPGFAELVVRAREVVLAALAHQELPFERLVEELRPVRDLGRNPVFQVMFTLQNVPRGRPPPRAGDAAPERQGMPIVGTGRAQFDLTLSVNEAGGALLCSFEYATDLFGAETATRMADEFIRIVDAACADPACPLSRLPLLSSAERSHVIASAGCEGGPAPAVSTLIAARARETPDAPALVSEAGVLPFGRLDREVSAWAAQLRARGVGPETKVGVCGWRAPELVIGALAVLRAGATYVPIDPDLPDARIALLCGDTRPGLILSQRGLAARWSGASVPWLALDEPPPLDGDPVTETPLAGAAAYIIFTSGTTGRPKGVVVTHGNLAHHVRALQQLYPLGPEHTMLQLTAIGFDASLLELCAPLAAGARLVVPRHGIQSNPAAIVEAIAKHRVTAIQVAPALLRAILDEAGFDRCRHLRRVYCGGDVLPIELARRFRAQLDAELLNLYGPTETAIDATSWRCCSEPTWSTVPIGAAIPGARVLVLDSQLEPLPVGVMGEIYIGGGGVARGYLDDPALTATRFIPDPFGPAGTRLYRTGDRGRRLTDGALEFLGREDAQVKLRGHRIELGEIEAVLRSHPAVIEVAAAVTGSDRARLVAVVTVSTPVLPNVLREHVAALLPAAVVPAVIRIVDALPLGSTGKIDRRAIASLIDNEPALPPEPPQPGVETELVAIWRTVLGVDSISRHDSFFELGGHSLLAIQLVARIQDRFGVELPLRQLFTHPTVAGVAQWLARAASPQPTGGTGDVPSELP
jgi:amino acid adenylation domain-containing protein